MGSTPVKQGTVPDNQSAASGPLRGIRVLEFAGLGPVPYAAMLLSDMGADVLRIDRPGTHRRPHDIVGRGRTSCELDLKDERDLEHVMYLSSQADVLLEGFRPGVMERLGLGPEPLLQKNPRLVYGRMTGWGQSGPLADKAGHDINYIALTGALSCIGQADGPPAVPLNLIGDYGGGSMFLAVGVLSALIEAGKSGRGQVVDCAICDGVTSLMSLFHSLTAAEAWHSRGTNQFDGGAHFYSTYECADGEYIAIGAGESKFYAAFRQVLGLSDPVFDDQRNRSNWPDLKQRVATVIKTRTRDDWMSRFEDWDACASPVLSISESLLHPHIQARNSVLEHQGIMQSAPAPRFSRTRSMIQEGRDLGSKQEIYACWPARESH